MSKMFRFVFSKVLLVPLEPGGQIVVEGALAGAQAGAQEGDGVSRTISGWC